MTQEREPHEQIELRFLENPEVRGVSKELITDLDDILHKFGDVIIRDETISFGFTASNESETPLYLSGSIKPESPIFMTVHKDRLIERIAMLKTNKGIIMWDKNLEAKLVKETVAKIDAIALQAGLIDLKNGSRISKPKETRFRMPGKYRAEDLTDGKAMAVMSYQDPEELLQQFDNPELLEIRRTPEGLVSISLKEDHKRLEKRESIAREVMSELGITFENAGDLPVSEIMRIRELIQKRSEESDVDSNN